MVVARAAESRRPKPDGYRWKGWIGLLFLWSLWAALPPSIQAQESVNPCAEGSFLDLSLDEPRCRPLFRPDLGADVQALFQSVPEQRFIVPAEGCTYRQVRSAIDEAGAVGGGLIDISACDTLLIDRPLSVYPNMILQGGGPGKTVLRPRVEEILTTGRDSLGSILDIRRARNVLVRDLTLDGGTVVHLGSAIMFSDNVLFERVEFAGMINNGVDFTHTLRFTVRYSEAHGTVLYNGLSTKDCYPNAVEFSVQECIVQRSRWAGGDFGFGAMFSSRYSMYSNHLRDNGDHCLALHARHGEIAGNLCEGGSSGFKFPDAQSIYVHHNLIRGAEHWGIHSYAPTKGIRPDSQYVFQNRIEESGWHAIRLSGVQAFVMHNRYARNATCVDGCPPGVPGPGYDGVRIVSSLFPDSTKANADVWICPDSRESRMGEDGLLPIGAITFIDQAACLAYGAFPLELTLLRAKQDTSGLMLVWETAREEATVGFAVEQASLGRPEFTEIGFVSGKGTVDKPTRYAYRIPEPVVGDYFFRLRQEVHDGPPNLTPALPVRIVADSILAPNEHTPLPGTGIRIGAAYPNPFEDRVLVQVEVDTPSTVLLDIVDVLGRTVRTLYDGILPAGSGQVISVSAGDLASGTYWIRLRSGRETLIRPIVRR